MPFVNIQILKGHPQERKDEIASRVTAAISELAQLPKEAIWVVFDEVAAEDWYVGAERVSEMKKRAATARYERRDPRSGASGTSSVDRVHVRAARHRLPVHRGPAVACRRRQYLLFSDMPGDHMRKWSAKDGVTTFRKPCAQSNGLTWDRQGRLLACEHATSRLTRTEQRRHDHA